MSLYTEDASEILPHPGIRGLERGLQMPTAKESLREQVDRLSEEEAKELLGLIGRKVSVPSATVKARLTREVVRERLANRPTFRVPAVEARPLRRRQRIQCSGILASDALIADRR